MNEKRLIIILTSALLIIIGVFVSFEIASSKSTKFSEEFVRIKIAEDDLVKQPIDILEIIDYYEYKIVSFSCKDNLNTLGIAKFIQKKNDVYKFQGLTLDINANTISGIVTPSSDYDGAHSGFICLVNNPDIDKIEVVSYAKNIKEEFINIVEVNKPLPALSIIDIKIPDTSITTKVRYYDRNGDIIKKND